MYYKFALPNIAANATRNVTANELGMSTPSGYKVLDYYRFTTGSVNLALTNVNPAATGTGTVMGLRNRTASVQSGKTAGIGIVYVKTGFGI